MSLVTNVILTRSLEEDSDLTAFNSHLQSHTGDRRHWFRELADIDIECDLETHVIGGSKFLEHYVAVSALNFCSTPALVQAVSTFPWKDPENVRLMVCEQEEDAFHQVWPTPTERG